MKDELDALRRAVDEATSRVIETECDLEEARKVAEDAAAYQRAKEGLRDDAVKALTQARAALDAKLGLRIVAAPLPVPAVLRAATPTPPMPDLDPLPVDDDEPVR